MPACLFVLIPTTACWIAKSLFLARVNPSASEQTVRSTTAMTAGPVRDQRFSDNVTKMNQGAETNTSSLDLSHTSVAVTRRVRAVPAIATVPSDRIIISQALSMLG